MPKVALLNAIGLVFLPVGVYTFGQFVVGPYEGTSGLAGFLSSIYTDLLRGKLAAWTLALSPAAVIAIWYIVLWLRRTHLAQETVDVDPGAS